ncbi:MAG: major facilitator superfamily 1 [Gammaproteobacteria bacterium]|jgi:hypothetical protein|nr:major facilitator superfamily 1 [Gammaproteobacteria bacterium]
MLAVHGRRVQPARVLSWEIAVAAGHIISTAQIGPSTKEYGFPAMPVNVLSVTLPLLTMTLATNNMRNGFTRPGLTGIHCES